MFAVLHIFNINNSDRHKADSFITRNAIIIIILFLFFSLPACYQLDLWENYYTIPDVTITYANATASTITFNWTYPPITDMNALYITCTDTSTGTVVHSDSVGQSVTSYTINSGLAASQRYNINMRITDKWGKSSLGINFAIITQAGNLHFIYSTDDLNAVRGGIYAGWNTGDTYNLMEDLDLSDPDYYNAGLGWEPISTFTGIFEGNGHNIRNLMINRLTIRAALFGLVDTGGIIRNVNLVNVNVKGTQYVGGLIAYNQNSGLISGCSVTGTINGSADSVGGLIAFNINGNVSSSYANVTVTGEGNYIGGLIGSNSAGSINNCYAISTVTATTVSTNSIGGLIGYNTGNINGCYARGSVIASAATIQSAGGLIGNAVYVTTIKDSYAEVNVTGTGNNTGGFIGMLTNNSATDNTTIDNCHATGTVNSSSNRTGGFIGYCQNSGSRIIDIINNCYASGAVSGTTETSGLIGYNYNSSTGTTNITNCYASGVVSGTTETGGLIGYNNNASTGTVNLNTCYHTTGTVTGTSATGGLVGNNSGDISSCFSSGIVNGAGNTGGLVGHNSTTTSSIDLSSSSCTVTGTGGNVGGLVGWCEYTSPTNSHATGNVTGYSINVGGLAGYKQSLMINCYATGHVTGYGTNTGGLIGRNQSGDIDTSYATGNVTVQVTALMTDAYAGGLVGYNNNGAISSSYAAGNVNTTYTSTSGGTVNVYVGGLIGYVNSAALITKSSFTGLVNTSIDGTGTKNINVGGFIGENFSGAISLCYFDGELYANSGTATVTYAGGLVGRLSAGSVDYSFSNGIVRANTLSNQGTGGLVGHHYGGTGISNSYSLCNVEADGTNVGGFVGMNDNFTTITRSYSAGPVGGAGTQGGFCGTNTGTITFSFYDQDVSGHSDAGKGYPTSHTAMIDQATFVAAGWSFPPPAGQTWLIDSTNHIINDGYPYLCYNWPY